MKKLFLLGTIFLLSLNFVFASGKSDAKNSESKSEVIASTSWTAAFADLAGVDNVKAIAPASLRHPPEYEVTVSDIETIHNSKYFVYAGFERMMKTLGDSVGNTQMIQIQCDNSIATVTANSKKIADILGTQTESEKRVAEYVSEIQNAKAEVAGKGYADAKVLCNRNQTYLAKELGLEIAATFGPGPVTSEQIADAKNNNYVFIIDNVHNPVGSPLVEVSPNSKYIVWRNFPETVEHNALLKVVQQNISEVLK